jgi:hypothetical protein
VRVSNALRSHAVGGLTRLRSWTRTPIGDSLASDGIVDMGRALPHTRRRRLGRPANQHDEVDECRIEASPAHRPELVDASLDRPRRLYGRSLSRRSSLAGRRRTRTSAGLTTALSGDRVPSGAPGPISGRRAIPSRSATAPPPIIERRADLSRDLRWKTADRSKRGLPRLRAPRPAAERLMLQPRAFY